MIYIAAAFLRDDAGEIVATLTLDPRTVWKRVDPKESVPGYEAQPWPGDIPGVIDRPGFPRPGDVVLLGEWPNPAAFDTDSKEGWRGNDERAGYCFLLQAYRYEPDGAWRYLSRSQTLAFLRRLRHGRHYRSPRYAHLAQR
jgi:hypothetical protein